MAKNKEKMLIIDGNALIHRSFHALPPTMTTKNGEPTNAVYGFAVVLFKAIRDFRPGYVVLTLDRPEPTFRHREYKDYKATRVKAPDELYAQIPKVKDLARAFGIPVYEKAGFEADDLIGSIAARLDGGIEKIIVTGDLDTLQLVNDRVKVYTMSRGLSDSVLYDAQAIVDRYGLKPEQMVDFKALRGDPSDNIPGVRGIGEKTAIDLLKEFKNLDKLYQNLESPKIRDRVRELLRQYEKDAFLSRRLATIERQAEIDFKLADAKFGQFDQAEAVKVLSALEFKSLLPRVHDLLGRQAARQNKEERQAAAEDKFGRNAKEFSYRLVDNDKGFRLFFAKIKKQKQFAFDTETTGFDPLSADLLGISFAWKEGEAYYLKIKNEEFPPKADQPLAEKMKNDIENNLFNYKNLKSQISNLKSVHPWLKALKPVFEDEKVKKFGHNAKFDIQVMQSAGVPVKGVSFDTMIASYLLNPGSRQHNLDAVAFAELGFEKITKDDLLGKGRERLGFGEVAVEKLASYSCEDADFTNRLVAKLSRALKRQKLDGLFAAIEMPLVPVLAAMESNGILIDEKVLAGLRCRIAKKLNESENKIYRLAGLKFNINSTRQLRAVLFEKLNIPADAVSKTKTGLSTAADELNKLKDLHPIVKLIQAQRELTKLLSTYVDALPALINKRTGRLHTSFNQTVTATGRLSSTEPNLQNIPVRTELGREIRKAFIARDGYRLLSLDYSQIELRLAAHMSGDRKMIKAFEAGADIHTATAAEINRLDPAAVTPALRREAKAINFGILYGQGPHGLSQTADIPYARAKDFIEEYFAVYRGVKKFIDTMIDRARTKGYAETLYGRRRYLPEMNSSVVQVRKAAERMAVNTPLQGTAADMIKVAMIKAEKFIKARYGSRVRMLLQVHDELLFEVEEALVADAAEEISLIMSGVVKLKVPVEVDLSCGLNWGEMAKIKASRNK
ncbi:MAG: DNA polymerase I [Planctomycetes bacterium]|jgi:DNA polymerase-1|nr:DNA polymerase I [Planctomycetota bacterium]